MTAAYQRLLGVNIDHVATIRQARGTRYPEPVQAALISEQAGADVITLHLREDRRHIQDRDVYMLKDILQTRMNLEMAATSEMLKIACDVKPADVCLVPERREELTTEGGLDVISNEDHLKSFCAELADAGVRVSLFIDADLNQIDAAVRVGAPVIEIHTGHYAEASADVFTGISTGISKEEELSRIRASVSHGIETGLHVNAGHGLDYHNVTQIAEIDGVKELNIGHAIIARAVFTGLDEAVSTMKRLIQV